MKPFAVFDIDGTLLRWQLYHATVDALAKAGKIDPKKFASARAARMIWKNRVNDNSFNDYQNTIVKVYDEAVTNISYEDYLAAARHVFEEYKGQTYTYTRDLIKKLKAKDYVLFAISASQIEAVELLAKHYGFDDWAGSHYELKNGKFTGRKQILAGNQKPLELDKLIKKHGV
ncbi:MAG: HAD family hydrolase, partial [Candidatus Saccharimonadales bacterium]